MHQGSSVPPSIGPKAWPQTDRKSSDPGQSGNSVLTSDSMDIEQETRSARSPIELPPLAKPTFDITEWMTVDHSTLSGTSDLPAWMLPAPIGPRSGYRDEDDNTARRESRPYLPSPWDAMGARRGSRGLLDDSQAQRFQPRSSPPQLLNPSPELSRTSLRAPNAPSAWLGGSESPRGEASSAPGSLRPGAFPADIAETEDFGHAEKITQPAYDNLLLSVRRLNDSYPYMPSKDKALLPSLEAVNCFVQLYFENFHPIFPILHQPTFDPNKAPWQMILAISAIGCRYSKAPGSQAAADEFQDYTKSMDVITWLLKSYGSSKPS
ncbi:hypothetical protein BDY21DRAFT_189709 [Lineolata rhizophorae]|uniref:Xylanolytic transcriptional activator regulatory domain-containing protein n=1 Tax=Lineolata rhizophorae TaxID=578093 RepID=A0A6A6P7H9_9PEZI|nr:hypothetical protein BDY21DRAFT_189709 [Lineolata rhizophorae]